MSVRECAIIQTFPDNFESFGSLGNMYKQIGNAVPVLLAKQIAGIIKDQLDDEKKIIRLKTSQTLFKKESSGI